jgi:hypothetical protein
MLELVAAKLDALGYEQDRVLGDPRIERYCQCHAIAPEQTRLF